MRELVARYLSQSISRRSFLKGLTTAGISLTAAREVLESLVPVAHAQNLEGVKIVEGTIKMNLRALESLFVPK